MYLGKRVLHNQIPFLVEQPIIAFGTDVTHPPANDFNRSSFAAVTASINSWAKHYASTVRVRGSRSKITENFTSKVKQILKTYVLEGQFRTVFKLEVCTHKLFWPLCHLKTYRPIVIFVMVRRRQHTSAVPIDWAIVRLEQTLTQTLSIRMRLTFSHLRQ
ncbi:hypothetical protein BDB00DRAFT_791490 [Zychaea mexicana]|uniref:uncharacterized protein n=1 Tax=Zychaea mexicana TaxID=64656 RepID=UPI0022FF1ADA|nr:uncharacterized protein BDB00DRAFT_791490 [Zychaea mexicana]KAI9488880.1 hypothetical protein BDB00DRAFT_791490 [Zychaea mexicana]